MGRSFYFLVVSSFLEATVSVEVYTQNEICRKNNCVNPLFPGMDDLPRLGVLQWQCPMTLGNMSAYMNFCRSAILYDAAIPTPNAAGVGLDKVVRAQDDAAATMFFYHMNALGYDAWEFQFPGQSSDSCVRAIQRLACYTYFPKALPGCREGQTTPYLRPCKTCCEHYVKQCQVECCDESAQCVFSRTETSIDNSTSFLVTGYVDASGPAASCTGIENSASGRSVPIALLVGLLGFQFSFFGGSDQSTTSSKAFRGSSRWNFGSWATVCMLAVMTLFLQGCEIPQHSVGNWQTSQNYLVKSAVIDPTTGMSRLNSCNINVPGIVQCSGRGYCKPWGYDQNSLAFCTCAPNYAGAECAFERKSQTKAFLLSLFGGILGLDYFYLGFPGWALAKVCTLGGCGFWWLFDIVRTGTGPVYAHDYRVAPDLPHIVFMLSTCFIFFVLGILGALYFFFLNRQNKRAAVMKLQRSEDMRFIDPKEANRYSPQYGVSNPMRSYNGEPAFTGYGATLPNNLYNAGEPYAMLPSEGMQGPFAGPYGPVR